jgi:uroporphyrinogen decarboxylase
MTKKEIVIEAIRHNGSDVIPFHLDFTIHAHKKMSVYLNDNDFLSKIGNYLLPLNAEPEQAFIETTPNIFKDSFGVDWNRTVDKDIGVVCNNLITPENINDYIFPDAKNPSIYQKFYDKIPSNPDKFIVANFGFSLFERAWTLAGMENVLMAMAIDKNFINDLLDKILEYNLKIIENCCKFDIDAMLFGDDWGQQTGIIMGPAKWREFIKPRVRKMYELVKSRGKFVCIHSCGKVDEIFPDLIECGLDVFNPFQPEVINVIEAKRKYGNNLTFYGGISTQRTLPFGNPEQTKKEVKKLLEVVGKDGGLIAAPSHAIPGDAKPENIMAMIEVLQNQ